MIDKHSYEQVHLKVEPKSFLYEFLNSGDPLYVKSQCDIHRHDEKLSQCCKSYTIFFADQS